jgi:hypothetical protein
MNGFVENYGRGQLRRMPCGVSLFVSAWTEVWAVDRGTLRSIQRRTNLPMYLSQRPGLCVQEWKSPTVHLRRVYHTMALSIP